MILNEDIQSLLLEFDYLLVNKESIPSQLGGQFNLISLDISNETYSSAKNNFIALLQQTLSDTSICDESVTLCQDDINNTQHLQLKYL